MPRFQDQITDEHLHPVPGAEIRVYHASGPNLGMAAALTDDIAQPLAQPLHSDTDGIFFYNAPDGLYENHVHYGGQLRYVQQAQLGTITAGPPGPPGEIAKATDRVELAAFTGIDGTVAYLAEAGREGIFMFRNANYSTQVAADPAQGIHIAPAADATGLSGAWVREFDGAGYPEWFGARPNDPTFDNLPALNAAVALLREVALEAVDYWINDTWVINRHYVTVKGVAANCGDTGHGTRIILHGANVGTATVVNIGPMGTISGMGSLTYQMRVSGITAVRDGVHVPNANPVLSATGIAVRGASNCVFDDLVVGGNNCIGLSIYATVVCRFGPGCLLTRGGAALADANDFWWACYIDGSARLGFAGGNASLTLDGVLVGTGYSGTPARGSIGVNLDGALTDTWLRNVEVGGGFQKGMLARGIAVTDPAFTNGNHDLHIVSPVIDGFSNMGLEIIELGTYGSVSIVDPYFAPALGATSCFHLANGGGLTTLTGGEALCWGASVEAGGNALGLLVQNASGIMVDHYKIVGSPRPVGLVSVTDFDIGCFINNPVEMGSQEAVALIGCSRGVVRARIKASAAPRWPQGVTLTAACTHVEVNCSGINPAAITGGAANKMVYNGVPVTTNTTVGTGIMATGQMA